MSNNSKAFVAFDSSKLRNAVAIADSGTKAGNHRGSTHAGGVRLELPTSAAGGQRQAGEGRVIKVYHHRAAHARHARRARLPPVQGLKPLPQAHACELDRFRPWPHRQSAWMQSADGIELRA